MTTVMARARCGRMTNQKRLSGRAPSISAASSCSLSRDWMAVSRIRVAKGSHCQLMIITSEGMDAWLSHCMGSAPKTRHKWAKNPLTGSMNMFFQTRPDTVGITKKGAMTRILTTP